MSGAGSTSRNPEDGGRRPRRLSRAVIPFAAVLLLLAPTASRALAAGTHEPNDSPVDATGPLAPNTTYAAAIEISHDVDFYSLYVTSKHRADVTLTLVNRGGGEGVSEVDLQMLDVTSTPIPDAGLPYVQPGEARSTSVSLGPGKYFVEVSSSFGHGDSYELVTGGGVGAFGSYGKITHRCGSASARVRAAKRRLKHSKTRLQRATSRLRRARFSTRRVRHLARRGYWRAKRKVRSKRLRLRRTRGLRQPWCSIPE